MNRQTAIAKATREFYQKPMATVSIELILTICFVLGLSVFAIQPTLTTMSELAEEIEQKKELDEDLSNKLNALTSVQETYKQVEPSLYLLEQAIPTKPNTVQDVKVIEKLASNHNLIITSLAVPEIPVVADSTLSVLQLSKQATPFSLTVRGEYSSIRSFIEELQNYRRVFTVESVSFGINNARRTNQAFLQASISLTAPYYSGKKANSDSGDTRKDTTP
ncbi:MAG: type 4a pilus biogenesis protein PilO [Pseudomonadales bacterium]|nr:type 4a pilus biogenesis protein PilO [Candidatus Woesebacteria bacterium]MCB9801777.1 type 4a pilus biogenesis protein PilO [Pseudomonadales bacterium]